MHIRLAHPADLEAMTAVLIGASPMDPVYPYRFPDRHLYPDEFAALCRRKCAEYLESSTVVVCEMAVDREDTERSRRDGYSTRVVAFSAWDLPADVQLPNKGRRASTVEPPSPTSPTHPNPPTAIGHLTRQTAFRAALTHHKALIFDAHPHYARSVFLKILLTHPSYQRRGAGTALTRWGIETARQLGGLYTAVFASPMGMRLYRGLGFREVGRFRVQLEGEGEFLEIPALVRGPGGKLSERAVVKRVVEVGQVDKTGEGLKREVPKREGSKRVVGEYGRRVGECGESRRWVEGAVYA
ncbi:putative N-acetyltransferase ycf52-like protein [Dichotomopilus funicola]|uniref:N-acetyltransferase ycf52-like protein n=1 Tax=Dichotomopilus funicola TaxID=1934379 RepID=A0AAN6UZ41_9PEZI|nr:putative N-acetyltransferase ycf52-like protein [Dichotomopilus funicola]